MGWHLSQLKEKQSHSDWWDKDVTRQEALACLLSSKNLCNNIRKKISIKQEGHEGLYHIVLPNSIWFFFSPKSRQKCNREPSEGRVLNGTPDNLAADFHYLIMKFNRADLLLHVSILVSLNLSNWRMPFEEDRCWKSFLSCQSKCCKAIPLKISTLNANDKMKENILLCVC